MLAFRRILQYFLRSAERPLSWVYFVEVRVCQNIWLVVSTYHPEKSWSSSQLGWWHSQLDWKNQKCSKPPTRYPKNLSKLSHVMPWLQLIGASAGDDLGLAGHLGLFGHSFPVEKILYSWAVARLRRDPTESPWLLRHGHPRRLDDLGLPPPFEETSIYTPGAGIS